MIKKEQEKLHFLARWSRFFIQNYKISVLFLVGLLVAGLWGLGNNQRQDFPTIDTNYIFVQGTYIGANAYDVESEMITPLESEITSSVKGIKEVRSSSSNNFGFISIEMESLDEIDKKLQEITEATNKTKLPQDAEVEVNMLDVVGPTMAFALYSDEISKDELLEYTPALERYLEGASSDIDRVDVSPANDLEVRITLDKDKLEQEGLTYDQVKQTIEGYLSTAPGGSIQTEDSINRPIFIESTIDSLQEIKELKVYGVELQEVSEITRQASQQEVFTLAGFVEDGETETKNSIYVMVFKKTDGDIITIAEDISVAMEDVYEKGLLPDNAKMVNIYDLSPDIQKQLDTLINNGLIGLIIILIVLFFFIDLRAGIVVSLIVPLAFLITLFVLPLLGFTINILTLFSMILILGILVDNAIVIAEGVIYHMERGKKKYESVIQTIQDLGPAVTVATATTLVVFIPFASIGGIMGEFLKFIPYTAMVMIIGSYFLAITITPLLAWWIMKHPEKKKQKALPTWKKALVLPVVIRGTQAAIAWVAERYQGMMKHLLKNKLRSWIIVGVSFVAFVASVMFFATKLDYEQFPSNDSPVAMASVEFPTGLNFEEKEKVYTDVAEVIVEAPHFKSYFFMEGMIYLQFVEPENREDGMTIQDITDVINEDLEEVRSNQRDDVIIEVSAQTYGPPTADFDVVVELTSGDLEKLETVSKDLTEYVVEKYDIERSENSTEGDLVPSISVKFDQEGLEKNFLTPLLASLAVNSEFSEKEVGSIVIREDGVSDSVVLEYDGEGEQSISTVENIELPSVVAVPGAPAQTKTLDDIAEIEEKDKLSSIRHLNEQRVASASFLVADGVDSIEVENAIKDYLSEDKLKEYGMTEDNIKYGGWNVTQGEDMENLSIVFLLSVLAVFIILVYQFRSYAQPLLILTTIPLALTGVFPGLLIVGSSINMISGLGIVALVGVVVNDAIVFIDYFNRLRRQFPKAKLADVLVKTGGVRLKPIFSTSITTMGSILPLTIMDPFWTGLGTAMISGLIFSTAGTLIVVPAIMNVFSRKKKK